MFCYQSDHTAPKSQHTVLKFHDGSTSLITCMNERSRGDSSHIARGILLYCLGHLFHTYARRGRGFTYVSIYSKKSLLHMFCSISICKVLLSYFVVFGDDLHCCFIFTVFLFMELSIEYFKIFPFKVGESSEE